jgi:hypothetical protein
MSNKGQKEPKKHREKEILGRDLGQSWYQQLVQYENEATTKRKTVRENRNKQKPEEEERSNTYCNESVFVFWACV